MSPELQIALLPLIGVIVGSLLTMMGNLLSKRQERKAQVFKLVTEARLSAYDELITLIMHVRLAAHVIIDGELVSFPGIFETSNEFNQWCSELVNVYSKRSHLFDSKLSAKVWALLEYIHHIEIYLAPFRNEEMGFDEPEKFKELGIVLNEDFNVLTTAILREASKFYSSDIFKNSFAPTSLKDESFKLPSDYGKLILFSKRNEIERIFK